MHMHTTLINSQQYTAYTHACMYARTNAHTDAHTHSRIKHKMHKIANELDSAKADQQK